MTERFSHIKDRVEQLIQEFDTAFDKCPLLDRLPREAAILTKLINKELKVASSNGEDRYISKPEIVMAANLKHELNRRYEVLLRSPLLQMKHKIYARRESIPEGEAADNSLASGAPGAYSPQKAIETESAQAKESRQTETLASEGRPDDYSPKKLKSKPKGPKPRDC